MDNKVIKTIKTRTSCRAYSDKKVPLAKLNTILDAGKMAPSAMNRQIANILAIRSKKYVEKFRDLSIQLRGKDCYYGATTLVLVYADENDRFTDVDCACILENIFIAANSLGISSCWINQTNDVLNLPEGLVLRNKLGLNGKKVVGTAILGYANKNVEKVIRERKADFIKVI